MSFVNGVLALPKTSYCIVLNCSALLEKVTLDLFRLWGSGDSSLLSNYGWPGRSSLSLLNISMISIHSLGMGSGEK